MTFNYVFNTATGHLNILGGTTEIPEEAFIDRDEVKSVSIADSVTSIGERAFFSSRLTAVVIPNSVTSIGKNAFYANGLYEVVIGDSVTSIARGAFSYNDLTAVVIPDSVTSISEYAFSENDLTDVVIPDSVKSIGRGAFQGNNLTEVVIPDSITSIGEDAFYRNNLTTIVIPDSITSIGNNAFRDNNLTEVTLPAHFQDNPPYDQFDLGVKFTFGSVIVPAPTPEPQPEPTPVEPISSEFAEYGSVSVNHQWQTIELQGDYENAVVITSDPTRNGGDPAVVRLRSIDSDSFQLKLQEPNYKDGAHVNETVSYMVIEEGTWELSDGTILEAGTLNTNKLSSQGHNTVALDAEFESGDSPAVLTQVQTYKGGDWVTTRTDNITGESFEVMMQEEERLNQGGHVTETIGYLAVETGAATDGDTIIEGGVTADKFTHQTKTHSFEASFESGPTLLTKLDSFDGHDTANSRIKSVDANGFSAMVNEEQSRDAEMGHTTESLSYLALDGSSGVLSGMAVI